MIKLIKKVDIDNALIETSRQYLIGKLARPQILNHIDDERIEIGITDYSDAICENTHTHSNAFEYQFVLSGHTIYMDVDTEEEYEFRSGDFYRISPGIKYAQKSKKGTRILFVKTPPGNDKIDIMNSDLVENWFKQGVKTVRKDYFNSKEAPSPNSIKPAVSVAIINSKTDKLLFVKRKDSGMWTLPGGVLEYGENLLQAALREVKEETGLDINILSLIGTYSSPRVLIEYSDGEVRQEFTLVYLGSTVEVSIKIDEESKDYCWVELEDAKNLIMADSQAVRVNDILEFLGDGKVRLK